MNDTERNNNGLGKTQRYTGNAYSQVDKENKSVGEDTEEEWKRGDL